MASWRIVRPCKQMFDGANASARKLGEATENVCWRRMCVLGRVWADVQWKGSEALKDGYEDGRWI